MHSVRRAVLRAASSSSSSVAAAASRQQVNSFALRFTNAAARPAVSMHARFFSDSPRSNRNPEERDTTDEATGESTDPAAPQPLPAAKSAAEPEQGAGIFINNMTFDATDVHVREAFSKYGEILQARIGRDGRGLSRGFAFVTFADKAAADRAVAECNKSFWHGRRINVEHRQPKEATEQSSARNKTEEPSNSLYIGNIPYETSDADLNSLFRELENVTDVRVAVDRNTGWPRGFAHADFADIQSAIKAHDKLAQTAMGGRMLRVDYSQQRAPGQNNKRGPHASQNSQLRRSFEQIREPMT